MASRELPFTTDDVDVSGRPNPTGPGWAQRERLGDQIRSVRRWIVFAGVAATAAFSWLAVHQTTTPTGTQAGSQPAQSQTTSLANAPSQSLFTDGTTSGGLGSSGGSGFSLAPAPRSGGSFFRSASS